jgi:hypothetical protein
MCRLVCCAQRRQKCYNLGMEPKHLSECTAAELDKYQIINVDNNPLAKDPLVIFGRKLTPPPDDGYEYSDVTTFGDDERKWERGIKRPV